jgi:hypothetical protein
MLYFFVYFFQKKIILFLNLYLFSEKCVEVGPADSCGDAIGEKVFFFFVFYLFIL